MFLDPRTRRIFVHREAVDLRKAHNGLSSLVTGSMGKSLLTGDVFLFVSRDRRAAKALVWDGSGLILLHKRMERCRIMAFDRLEPVHEVSAHDFTLLLGGAKLTLHVTIKPAE